MRTIEKCVHQIFLPKEEHSTTISYSSGNCRECIPDEGNGYCPGYVPMKIKIIKIEKD